MSHPAVMRALSGLLMGMFVSILAGTVVSTSMPRIISELGGNQAAFTWVITSTLLATTVSTPIWGKFADLMNRKLLIQIALVIFVLGSALAGFSQDTGTLIAFRVMQGLGGGGLAALSQIIMADIISPRERGRYMGLFGAVMAVGTVGGPLAGGMITDAFGWRWNFFVALPFALAAILLLQRNLHLPVRAKIKARIDYLGMVLIGGGVSLLLIWVTLAGHDFEWLSPTSLIMVGVSIVMLAVAVVVELRVAEPIIPMSLFKNRTFTLAVIASISVGVAMFGTSVFLGQYMQLARGATPTQSGLLTLPMIGGLLISSTVAGMLISKYGKWKVYMVTGSIALAVGMFLMGTIHYDTNYVLVSVYMFVLGVGVGMVMQNLVLIVQNAVEPQELGVASSGVTFFRSLGGTIGISALGAVLATKVADGLTARTADLQSALAQLGPSGAEVGASLNSGTIPQMDQLPVTIRTIVESVYGQAVADIFMIAAPLALITILAIVFLPNKSLSNKTTRQRLAEQEGDVHTPTSDTLVAVSEASVAGASGSLPTGSISVIPAPAEDTPKPPRDQK
ncbi:DHA2 family efflux MFS transporter permease subunit [Mycetocola spongiae]|uniref:DHA2 family efflux MFS transporter permease subunit n=1 Tax=Mycetocola spongiae TaxID=2859226 RepID=UPI001CF3ECC0|nr:DHA2 family efflux MFS transporter permease subunit [Mycetocola spongiae]UCR90609.1 MFS transporter [Mycetocola spongiae]